MDRIICLLMVFLMGLGYEMNGQELVDSQVISNSDEDFTLVMYLQSHRRKINQLEQLLARDKISESQRNKLKEVFLETYSYRDRKNKILMESMTKYYQYSKVLFSYDFEKDKEPGDTIVFLSSTLEKSLAPLPDKIIKATWERGSPTETTNLYGWTLRPKNVRISNCPKRIVVNNLKRALRGLFHSENGDITENSIDIAQKFNEKFKTKDRK